MSKNRNEPLRCGCTYHILNQGNNGVNIFIEPKNYTYFLKKLRHYIVPIADVYAYCLMPNHFHLALQIKPLAVIKALFPKKIISQADILLEYEAAEKVISTQFRLYFGGYARAIHKTYGTKGKLLAQPFKRILIEEVDYFQYAIAYTHRNGIHHGFVKEYIDYEHSSYRIYLDNQPTFIKRDFVLDLFDGLAAFLEYHEHVKKKDNDEKREF